jgi:hypothetical protein
VNLDKAHFGNNNFEEPGVDLDNMDGYKTKTMPSKNWDNTNVDEEAPF